MELVKYYAPEHHLIIGRVIECKHEDKNNKLLSCCYKLFNTKQLFAFYDVQKNTLYTLDVEHPDVEKTLIILSERYKCIIDICSKHILHSLIQGCDCRYKCSKN